MYPANIPSLWPRASRQMRINEYQAGLRPSAAPLLEKRFIKTFEAPFGKNQKEASLYNYN